MKISLNWLQDFVEITEKDNEKVKEIITARSAEIETMESTGDHLKDIVVGRVEKLMPHPNADKLRIAIVDDGQSKIQVVCGGSNLKEGMKVAFAPVGSVVKWHGTDVMKLETVKLRGEESNGMICSSPEVGLEEMFPLKESHEIVDLSHIDSPIGTPLAKALGLDDTVIDIDNHAITNRSDLFSHRGFAREFVACGLAKWKKFKWAEYNKSELPDNNSPAPIEVTIKDSEICSNYFGVYITGIEVKESPDWMKKRLTAIGIRPISNIVDITNYVMYELGMPTHAFDVDLVKGKQWAMRKSKKGEKVITLDEKELELFDDISVLDDGIELFDLCGIMGGLHSGINSKTNRVWLHSPVDDATTTRKAMRGLGQISDAGIIYEKGVDNELAKDGLNRCIELILECCPDAKIASKVTHIQNYKPENRVIKLRSQQIERLVGAKISEKEVQKILSDLGFEVKSNKEGFDVTVPSWRLNDVSMEADLIEEIARVYSYDAIPFTTPEMDISPIPVSKRRMYDKELKEKLVSFGFNEIYTFSFVGPDLHDKCGIKDNDVSIVVANPISSDMSLMRQTLLPRMLETISDNLRYKKAFRLFELSRTYHKVDGEIKEPTSLIMASAGEGFRGLQGVVENLGFTIRPSSGDVLPFHHPGRIATLMLRGKVVGSIYELHPQIAKNFDIKETVVIADIGLNQIHAMEIDHKPKYVEIPKYPSIKLDVSILIPKKDLADNYFKAIQKTDKTLVKNIELIDEYAGESIGKDKRSLTYSITYRSDSETLTDEHVEGIHKSVLANLKSAGAVVRD